MRTICTLMLAIAFVGDAALAQTTPQTPAIKDPSVRNAPPDRGTTGRGTGTEGVAAIAPLSVLENGANSFTEAQARSRLESVGFTNITEFQKDAQGIWRGKAMREGRSVSVGLDYQGTIGSQ